jgi:predicted membrane protein
VLVQVSVGNVKHQTIDLIPSLILFSWLDGKRLEDRAEGLWRIHDELYDLTDFVDQHPGGESWIRFTRGTDITEAFEIHHLTTLPVQMLKKYWVRQAAQPRLYRFTFNEDGFYKTLRKKVLERMKTMDKSKASTTKTILDTLLALTFALAIGSAALNSVKLSIVTGVIMCWAIIASHNFFHQRDNWRMKVFNLGFLTYM